MVTDLLLLRHLERARPHELGPSFHNNMSDPEKVGRRCNLAGPSSVWESTRLGEQVIAVQPWTIVVPQRIPWAKASGKCKYLLVV